MFKREASLQKLEDMIADQILGDDQSVDLDGDKASLENWPAEYKAYQEVMKADAKTRDLDVKCVELEGYAAARTSALAKLLALRDSSTTALATATRDRDKAKKSLTEKEDAYIEERSAAKDETETAQREVTRLTDAIDEIEDARRQAESLGIHTKVALAERRLEIEAEQKSAHDRLNALQGSHDDLTRTYEAIKQEARKDSAAQIESLQNDKQAAQEAHDASAAEAKERHILEEAEVQTRHVAPMREAEEAVEKATSELGAAQEGLRNPAAPQHIIDARDEAQAQLTTCTQAHATSLEEGTALEAALRAASADLAAVEKELHEQNRELEALEAKKADLESSKKPPAGSLLAYLRSTREDWVEDIGKVIRTDLLFRTDLSPRQVETESDLFGLVLDLEDVATNEHADLSDIDEEIAACKVEIAELSDKITRTETRMIAAGRVRTESNAALTRHTGERENLKRAVEAAKEAFKARKEDLEQARATAKEGAEARLKTAETACREAKKARHEATAARDEELKDVKAVHAEELKVIKKTLDVARKRIAERTTEAKARLAEREKEIRDELNGALREEGVDPEVMKGLQSTIDSCEADLLSIRINSEEVQNWKLFVANKLPKLPELRTSLTTAKRVHEAKKAVEAELGRKWRKAKEDLKATVDQHAKRIQILSETLSKIAERLAHVDTADITPVGTVVEPLDELINQMNRSEKAARGLERDIRTGVTAVAKIFEANPGSPAEQHLREHKSRFASTVEGPEWVPALIDWFDSRHRQHRESLMQNGRRIADKIKARFFRLTALDRNISAQNRLLQQNLDRNNVINVVQDLNVSITSSIRDLEFMPDMKRLSALHETWMKSGSIEPPEGFSDAMADLLRHWTGKNGLSADLRDHIRIEGYIIENGNRRAFHARTDMKNLSSNGISYLVLTTILVAFVNMVRGKAAVHMVWALDELGDLDSANTRRLLDMLRENNITLVSATPRAPADVHSRFDYRIKVIAGPRLADIRNAGRSSQRLLFSPTSAKAGSNPGELPAEAAPHATTDKDK